MPTQHNSNISFLDNSLVKEYSLFYSLCLEIGENGISFAIYHKQKNIFLGLENFIFEKTDSDTEIIPSLEQVLNKTEWLNLSFSKVIILINNTNNTLIPLALFNEDDIRHYLKFNQRVSENDAIDHDFLRNSQSVNVYSTPEIIESFFKKRWPEAKRIHYSSCVIEALSNQFKNLTDNKTLYINVRSGILDIVYFKDAKLYFYNSFLFKSKEDFAYFLLLTMEQLHLSPEDTKIEITGNITEETEIYQIMHDYIRHHSFIERNRSYNFSEKLNKEICGQFYVLLNALQCG